MGGRDRVDWEAKKYRLIFDMYFWLLLFRETKEDERRTNAVLVVSCLACLPGIAFPLPLLLFDRRSE